MGMVASLLRRELGAGGGEHKPPLRGLKETAFSHALAKNWREAALAFGEQAAYDLELGNELGAANALLRSAKCYTKIQGEEEATKLALEKAVALFVKTKDLKHAASTCVELAEFYLDHQELQGALDFFQQAAVYYGSDRCSRYCRFIADRIKYVLDNKETYHQSSSDDLHSQLYEVLATGIIF